MSFYYLIASICAILSYDIARSITTFESKFQIFTNNKLPGLNVMTTIWYCDIMVLLVIIILSPVLNYRYKINIFDIKMYKKNFKVMLLLLVPMFSAIFKSYIASHFYGNTITTYSLLTPFMALILSFLILKEKLSFKYLLIIILAFLGFLVTKIDKIHFDINYLIFLYVIINSFSVIAVRYVSLKRNKIDGILFDNMVYALFGLSMFLIYGNFDFKILFSWQIVLISILSIGHHSFSIIGNQKAIHTGSIIMVEILKVVFVFISVFIFFRIKPSRHEFMGSLIMIVALLFLKIFNNKKKI